MSSNQSIGRVVVAILNWNGVHHLQSYLPSVIQHSEEDADVVIIDNGSTDQSAAWCAANHPKVTWIQLTDNLGFAGGYNAGLAQIEAQTFILLNSDVRVTAGWIPPVLKMMREGPFVACQPILRNDTDPELLEYAGAAGGFMDRDGYAFCAGRIFEVFETDVQQYASNREIFWASGAALFIDAKAYQDVGGLDPDFFAHMEEIDLCWRLKNRGHRVGCCGESVVYHLGGGTLQQVNPFKTYLNFRNNLFLLVKNHHLKPLYPFLLRRMTLDGIAALKFLLEGNFSLFLAVCRAHRDFWSRFSVMKQRRKDEETAIQTGHNPGPSGVLNYSGWYRKSILIAYFFKNRKVFSELDSNGFESAVKRE